MASCHLCGSEVTEGFECADCGGLTCVGCKSIGVGRDSDHCQRCRG